MVEFRPKLDPSAELFDSLFEQIVTPVLQCDAPESIDSGCSRSARLQNSIGECGR